MTPLSFQQTIEMLLLIIGGLIGFGAAIALIYFSVSWPLLTLLRLVNLPKSGVVENKKLHTIIQLNRVKANLTERIRHDWKIIILILGLIIQIVDKHTTDHADLYGILFCLGAFGIFIYMVTPFNILAIICLGLIAGVIAAPFLSHHEYKQNGMRPALETASVTILAGPAILMGFASVLFIISQG